MQAHASSVLSSSLNDIEVEVTHFLWKRKEKKERISQASSETERVDVSDLNSL